MTTSIIEVLLNEQDRQAAEQRDAEQLSRLSSIRRSMLDNKKSAQSSEASNKETAKGVTELVAFFKRWHNSGSSQDAPHDKKTVAAEKLLHKKEYLENLKRLKAIKTAITDSNRELIAELRDQESRALLRANRKHAPQHISPWSRTLEYRKVEKKQQQQQQQNQQQGRSLLDDLLDNMGGEDRRGRNRARKRATRTGRWGRTRAFFGAARDRIGGVARSVAEKGSGFMSGARRVAGSTLDRGKSLLGVGRAAEEGASGVAKASRVAGSVAPEAGFFARNAGKIKGLGIAGAALGIGLGAKELYDIRNSEAPEESKNRATAGFAGRATGGIAGGWAGASAGAAIGALGGPAAPVTVPLGALIGGGIGAFAGDKVGDTAGTGMFDFFHKKEEKKPADSGNTNLMVAKAVAINTKTYKDTTENKLVPAMSDISKTFKDGWKGFTDSASDLAKSAGTWTANKMQAAGGGAQSLLHRGGEALQSATKGTMLEGAGKSIAGGADFLGGKMKAAADYGAQAITGVIDNGGTSKTRVFKKADGTVEQRDGGTISWRNNNPGNLRTSYVGGRSDVAPQFKSKEAALAHYQKKYDGLVDLDYNGDFIFATQQAGDEAKRKRVFQTAGNKTFDQMIQGYAKDDRSGKADHSAYANTVFKAVRAAGFNPEQYRGMQLSQMPREVQDAVMTGMKQAEGYKEGKVSVTGTPQPVGKPTPAGASPTQTAKAPVATPPVATAKVDVNGKAPQAATQTTKTASTATAAQAPTVNKVQQQVPNASTVSKPQAVAVNEIRATPQPLVPQSVPREAVRAHVDNLPEQTAQADSTPQQTSYNGARGGVGPMPTLDDVPGSISELGLAFLNLGSS